jgi:hypothetical protein
MVDSILRSILFHLCLWIAGVYLDAGKLLLVFEAATVETGQFVQAAG